MRFTRARRGGTIATAALSCALATAFTAGAQASSTAVPANTGPMHVLHQLKVGPAGQTTSTNWAGYADTSAGGTYSQVSSSWSEPAVTCTQTESIAVFWVGIDGYTSGSVEQDGSLAYCLNGQPSYYTWWEMYPTNAVQIVGTTVQPGDMITSAVVRTGTSYKLTVTDATHSANSFSITQTCASCANSSAEWVAERPSGGSGLYPLPDFGKIAFKKAAATSSSGSGSISDFPNDAITMKNTSGQTLVSVGGLKKHGTKFTAKWHRIS